MKVFMKAYTYFYIKANYGFSLKMSIVELNFQVIFKIRFPVDIFTFYGIKSVVDQVFLYKG